MEKEEFLRILSKHLQGTATAEEEAFLDAYYQLFSSNQDVMRQFSSQERIQLKDRIKTRIDQQRAAYIKPRGTAIRPYYMVAAAMVLIALATALYFYRSGSTVHDIAPGGNRATLTLADGTKINLDSAKAGIQINDEHIVYNDKTPLNVILSGEARRERERDEGSLPTSLTLSTPKGGQYQIILSDGTKVWLNAASTLKYPSRFNDDKREVMLEGEGYFEIKEDKKRPFKVLSKNQEISVLGTSFNLTAYADESSARTTLITGAVRITNSAGASVSLVPNEQSIIQSNGNLTKAKVDINTELGWKNGEISFNDDPLEVIMRRIERWYNVDVEYRGADKQKRFGGSASRYAEVSAVLRKLQLAGGVHFKVEGRRIMVME